ncbi:MAG TPA: NAD(P)/FAD-dependent oxidoreductase [Candidatus Binatia bacterium]|jgi:glycerol-3-phosphate dehydrogenase
MSADAPFDVAVIGAGVVGAAIARDLARTEARTLLLEAGADVGAGTSKANTAILHTGFDAKPGTLEARLVRRGYELLTRHAPGAGIPVERLGAVLVAWDEEQRVALSGIVEVARRNGYDAIRPLEAAELYAREPRLGPGALAALEIPDESIICPFTTPLAFATEAVANGATLRLEAPLQGIAADAEGVYALATPHGTVCARWVVNAAGLFADAVDRMFGHDGFTVTPRRGELIVFDKLARPLVRHIVLPVPTRTTKGVLVSPTVFGNVMVGPTADDVPDKTVAESTASGLRGLCERARRIVPALAGEEVTSVYVGLRAATEHGDYQIRVDPARRYVCVGGIRSTGLTASMAIAEHVCDGLRDAGLALAPRDDVHGVRMPNLGEAFPRPYQRAELIAQDPGYGQIVCHCERVTRREILDAAAALVPARSLDGLRRRTRATLGRCQGFYCVATVARLLAEASGRSMADLLAVVEDASR